MKSTYQNLGGVIEMPTFAGRNLYMYKTSMTNPVLPSGFNDFQSILEKVLAKVENRNNVCYITIDEKRIKNDTHRRAGIHVDFNWYEEIKAHGNGGHKRVIGMHSRPKPGGHQRVGKWDEQPPRWNEEFKDLGGMLLVSNYEGCKAYRGEFDGEIGEGGCCKDINVSGLESEVMKSGHVYFVNSLGIHESLKITGEIDRTLIRINFHPEYKFQ